MKKRRFPRQEIVAMLEYAGRAGSATWLFRKLGVKAKPFYPWKKTSGRTIGGGDVRNPRHDRRLG